jgi:lipoprotein-anchoring transpeptidase ErfK/SrfK
MGYPLSSVSSAGDDAPPLPPDSGSGRRIVYHRGGQRVWAVGDEGQIIRSWLVSGSKYSNELPGTHEVYSRSEMSTAWNGKAYLPKMVRWLKTDIGAIGFHAIPLHRSDNSPYQTEDELGQRLSGGCQRQANRDAAFLWDFAQVGTKVVVI